MNRPLSLFGASAVLAATLLVTTSCASTSGGDAQPSASPTPQATSPEPTPGGTSAGEPSAEPKCDTIIPEPIVTDFTSVGWTVRAEPFRVGQIEIAEGVQCIWGDFTTATDHVQIFGWAPIGPDDAVEAQEQLVALDWRVEETREGLIVTESTETTIAPDADGYGLTYLFGDGWVKYADTKQGLLLVTWPSP